MSKTFAEMLDDYDRERIAQIEKDDTPEFRARLAAKSLAEHDKGVRLGWWDEEGTPIEQGEDADDDDDDDDDDDEQEEE